MEYLHNNTPTGVVNGEPANLYSVLILDRLHKLLSHSGLVFAAIETETRAYSKLGKWRATCTYWGFADDLYQLFASVSVLIDLADIPRSQRLIQGDIDGQVNAAEPGCAG